MHTAAMHPAARKAAKSALHRPLPPGAQLAPPLTADGLAALPAPKVGVAIPSYHLVLSSAHLGGGPRQLMRVQPWQDAKVRGA